MTTVTTIQPTVTEEEAEANALAAHQETHAAAIAAGASPEEAVKAMIEANDAKLEAGEITQTAHDKLTEIYTEAGADSQKFSTLMVQNNGLFEQEAVKLAEDNAKNNVLTNMLAERGIDLDDLGSFGAIFAVIFAMIDPDFSKEMMAKMDGLNQSTPTTTTLTTTTTPTTTPTDPEVTASTDADASVVAGNEQEPEEVVENDLGGVNGNAVTVVVDNSANGAQPVVDHDSGSVTLNGASVVSRFNEDLVNPDNATSVDAMVDSNVVVGIPPFDFSLAGNEVSELGF